jgi:hypothetical protein
MQQYGFRLIGLMMGQGECIGVCLIRDTGECAVPFPPQRLLQTDTGMRSDFRWLKIPDRHRHIDHASDLLHCFSSSIRLFVLAMMNMGDRQCHYVLALELGEYPYQCYGIFAAATREQDMWTLRWQCA